MAIQYKIYFIEMVIFLLRMKKVKRELFKRIRAVTNVK